MSQSPLTQYNPNDPLNGRIKTSRDLYAKMVQVAANHPMDTVIEASVNLLVNGMRQTYATKREAEQRSADVCNQIQQILSEHYDSITGRRRNIFPHDQRVVMPLHIDKDKF